MSNTKRFVREIVPDESGTRGTGRPRRPGGALVALTAWVLLAIPAGAVFGQEDQMVLQEREQRVTQLTRTVTFDGGPYVNTRPEYNPDQRVILPQNAQIDFPVSMSDAEWRSQLGNERYHVLREDGTERAFSNALWDNHERGIYYSAATGQPLFRSEASKRTRTKAVGSTNMPTRNSCSAILLNSTVPPMR